MRTRFLYQNLPMYDVDGASGGGSPSSLSPTGTAPASPSPSPAASAATPSSSSPSPEPASDPNLSTGGEGFGGLDGSLDDDGDTIILDPIPAPAADPALVATDGSPAPAPQAKPVVDPNAAKPPVPAAAPQEPAAAQAQPAPSSAQAEPQSLVQQLDQHRELVIAGLAAKEFALTKEEAELIELDATKAIPQLMAKTYYRATQSALLHIQNFVPQMVVSMVKALNDQSKAEDAFYGKYPHLDRTKHGQDVNSFSQAFRSSNVGMKQEDVLSMAAAAVAAKFGLQPGAPQAAPGAPPAPTPQPRVPAFVPARPGVGVRVTPEPESSFAGLAQDFDN